MNLSQLPQDIETQGTLWLKALRAYEKEKLQLDMIEAGKRETFRQTQPPTERPYGVEKLGDLLALDDEVQLARHKLLDRKLDLEAARIKTDRLLNEFASARKEATLEAARISSRVDLN